MTMPIPDGSVVITPAQMYQQIGESAKLIEALTGEVRAMRGELNPAVADLRSDIHDHETSIRSLMQTTTTMKAQLKAAWAGIGMLIAALVAVATVLQHGH